MSKSAQFGQYFDYHLTKKIVVVEEVGVVASLWWRLPKWDYTPEFCVSTSGTPIDEMITTICFFLSHIAEVVEKGGSRRDYVFLGVREERFWSHVFTREILD